MNRRCIGQEAFGFAQDGESGSTLDALPRVIDWAPTDQRLATISSAGQGGTRLAPGGLVQGDATRGVVRPFRRQAGRSAR